MSLVLNGTTQYLKRTSTPITDVPVTISCWFQSDSVTASQALASLEDGVNEFYLLQAAGAIAGDPVRAMSYSGTWRVAATTTGYSAGTWTHALGIFAADNDRRAFISGGSKGTESTAEDVAAASYIMVGAYKASVPTGFFDGKLAELAMWNIALSDANAASLAAGVLPTAIEAANLIGYWPLFDDANDDKGTANLTEIGSPSYDTADHPESYVELAASGGGTGSGSAAMQVMKWRRLLHEGMTDATVPGLTLTNTLNMPAAGTIGFSGDIDLIARDYTLALQSNIANRLSVLRVMPKGVYAGSNPQSALEFFGSDFLADATNYHRLQILAYNNATALMDIRTDANGANTIPALCLYTEGNANQLYLGTNGKVGVGNAAPNEKLEVTGKIRTSDCFNHAGSDGIDDTAAGTLVDAHVAGGIVTAVTRVTPAADNAYAYPTTITIDEGIVTAITAGSAPTTGSVITLRENNHASNYDYTVANFTTDGTWRDLDLSSILPAGTTKFWCRTVVVDDVVTSLFGLRKNGNTGISDAHWVRAETANAYHDLGPIGVDGDRKCEYYGTNTTFTTINVVITAYST